MTEQELFVEAVQISDSAARDAYLDRACADDAALRRRIAGLLGALGRAGGFLEDPAAVAAELGATRDFRPDASAEAAGDIVGPYKLLEQIGEGGFGVVFMAEQTHPVRRKVALKVLKPGMDTRQVVARFEAERQALALMDHPNIARVLETGSTGAGRPYFVMELVRGIPITQFCDDKRLTTRERLGLFMDVCRAVQHAHQKGIIHRDLKPTNVLVTLHDGTPVVKVIDFGIAKALGQQLTDKTLFTGYAQLIGTPLYMSPEQAELSGLDVDTRSDIYSLGVLLYELLTGTTPLDKDRLSKVGYDELRRIIREEEPPPPSTRISTLGAAAATVSANRHSDPRKLTQLVRGELDWIVMKCLEKDRNRRYETVSALAADVQRYLSDEPVQACPPSAWYRCRKLARRNKRAVAMASVVGLALLLAVAALATSTVLISRALRSETEAKGQLDKTLKQERVDAYFHRITLAHHALSADDLGRALKLLGECPEDLREWEWHYLMRLCKVEPVVFRENTGVQSVAFCPVEESIAVAHSDGTVRILNCRTGQVIRRIEAHGDSAVSVAFHPRGKHVASAGTDRQVKVWDLATGQVVFTGECDAIRKFGASHTVAFSPADGRQLAAGCDGTVKIWNWKDQQLLHAFPGHENHSIPVAFSRDGRHLATGGAFLEGQKLWDTQAGGPPLRTFPAHGHPVSALAFNPDGGQLASGSLDKSVKLWDTTTGGLLHTFAHAQNVLSVAFSPDGRRLASTGQDKTVRVWDATSGREVLALRGHTDLCGCVVFSPDGRRLASASSDGTIHFWDATPLQGDEGQEALTFTQHREEVRSVAFSPDGQTIASAGMGTLVKVWDATTGRLRVGFSAHTVIVFGLAWQPDGQRIATAGADLPLHTVKAWDAQTGREAFALQAGRETLTGAYHAVAFSPDGRYLVTGKLSGAVQVWDAGTGQPICTLGTHDREIRAVVFSRDGRHLASASSDGRVKLWDATRLTEEPNARFTLDARVPGASVNVAFSPDGRRLATGGEENTIKIWDVQSGQELHTLRGHNGEVYTVAFSPDDEGRWIVSAGEDSAVKVWDSHTGKFVRNFRGHTGVVTSLSFSRNGRRLASGSSDTTVKVWDVSQLAEGPGH